MKLQEEGSLTAHVQKPRLTTGLLHSYVCITHGFNILNCHDNCKGTDLHKLLSWVAVVCQCVWKLPAASTVRYSVSGGRNRSEGARSKHGLDLQEGEWLQPLGISTVFPFVFTVGSLLEVSLQSRVLLEDRQEMSSYGTQRPFPRYRSGPRAK